MVLSVLSSLARTGGSLGVGAGGSRLGVGLVLGGSGEAEAEGGGSWTGGGIWGSWTVSEGAEVRGGGEGGRRSVGAGGSAVGTCSVLAKEKKKHVTPSG